MKYISYLEKKTPLIIATHPDIFNILVRPHVHIYTVLLSSIAAGFELWSLWTLVRRVNHYTPEAT